MELYVCNVCVKKLKTCARELEKQIEQSSSRVRVAESKYLLL